MRAARVTGGLGTSPEGPGPRPERPQRFGVVLAVDALAPLTVATVVVARRDGAAFGSQSLSRLALGFGLGPEVTLW